jgi:alkanesulfonate monooxygenase SsuD/methylene tetrahydromethanopterin reductase-like flavin-dependent oxidoreductase (luciferase family)
MDLGLHLPLMQFGDDDEISPQRLGEAVDAAREHGFAAVSANDHFVFSTPWLDGPTALASVIDRSGEMTLATTLALAVLRGPVPLAKALAALDVLSGGRVIAAVGPGSSARDYDALGIDFDQRWKRLDEAIASLRALLGGGPVPQDARYYPIPADLELAPAPAQERGVPIWVGSWGSAAGLRRVARLGDGWLASAYNTTPQEFATARDQLAAELEALGRAAAGFPNGLATMWTWVTEDRSERDRMLGDVLGPLLRRDPAELAGRLCIGPAEDCAAILSAYAQSGCERVYLWPLGEERRQIELVARDVVPRLET